MAGLIIVSIIFYAVTRLCSHSPDGPPEASQGARPTVHRYEQAGIINMQSGQYAEAVVEFQKFIQIEPNNFEGRLLLANSYKAIGKYQLALTHLKKAVELEPNNFDANWNVGHAYLHTNDYENTLKHFKKAAELEPNHFGASSMIGHVYLDTDRFKEAIEQFEKSLTIPSDNHGAVEDTKRGLQRARYMENGEK